MLLFLAILGTQLTDALGLIAAVMAIEVAREIRAWQRGRRLRAVERDIEECLRNHPKAARKRKPKAQGPTPPVHGPN